MVNYKKIVISGFVLIIVGSVYNSVIASILSVPRFYPAIQRATGR